MSSILSTVMILSIVSCVDLKTACDDDEVPLSAINGRDLSVEMQLQTWQSHILTSVAIMKTNVGQVEGLSL